MKRFSVVVAFVLVVTGCSETQGPLPFDGAASSNPPLAAEASIDTPTTLNELASVLELKYPVTTRPLVETNHLGFVRCGEGLYRAGTITPERETEILDAVHEAGIAVSVGRAGAPGRLPRIGLKVLDEAGLSTLAEIADPSEVCIWGLDRNDYVAPGPQALSGPGWRWVGAGSAVPSGPYSLVSNQEEYNELWTYLGHGPETEQLQVDFEQEVIVTMNHTGGVDPEPCGFRFEGFGVAPDDVVVLDLVRVHGTLVCATIGRRRAYAVAIDRAVFQPEKVTIAERTGPRAMPTEGAPPVVFGSMIQTGR